MGKIETVGKGGACRMGKLKYCFFPGTYTRSASELDRAWLVTMLRKKKRVMGKNMGNMEKIGYWWGKDIGIWEKLGILWGKKSEYGKNWVRFRKILLCPGGHELYARSMQYIRY